MTITRIMLDAILEDDGLVDCVRACVSRNCQSHSDALSIVEEFLRQTVESFLCGSEMPQFAQRVLSHALENHCDWRLIGERILVNPEDN